MFYWKHPKLKTTIFLLRQRLTIFPFGALGITTTKQKIYNKEPFAKLQFSNLSLLTQLLKE